MKPFEIAGRQIGPDAPPFVIAEVGINHEGSFDKAIQCVDAAVEAGAECIKFQCHITEAEMVPTDMKPGEISDERLWDIIKRCELTADEELKVQEYCASKGIMYLSTPFSREAADRLEAMGVPAFKIGSGECNNLPLIDHIAAKGLPMIVSTGMNNLESVRETVAVVQKHGTPLALMHCTSEYPTPYEHVRLGAVPELIETFDVPVGLSDHSLGVYTCLGAVALGATILEKHFTVAKDWPGPDVPISIDPAELKELLVGSRAIWEARGGAKTVLDTEKPVIDFAYASVVTIKDIAAGEPFTKENTWVKRPGTGPLHAKELDKVLGRRARNALAAGTAIALEDLS